MTERLPIGVCVRAIGSEPSWWLESARRLDEAGYAGIWCWDHLQGRRDMTVPVVEGWTAVSMAAAATTRATIGPFVINVMNRHPALVARMSATLQAASGGRLILGLGIGGGDDEHEAYGIDFPPPAERVRRLEEAVAVIRALWTGGPVTRPSPFYPLHQAWAHPVPDPPPACRGRSAGRARTYRRAPSSHRRSGLPAVRRPASAHRSGWAAADPGPDAPMPGGAGKTARAASPDRQSTAHE